MARVDLTIKKDYLPGWGLWEGVRELVQNGRDAETEYKAPLTVEWRASSTAALGGSLHIENEGCVMPRKALLFGETSKDGREDMIGKFGEGLKIGVLALVRLGRSVTIRTGPEVWKPSLKYSDEFGESVLSFQIQTGRADKSRVQIEIECKREEWEDFRDRFLFLGRETPDDRVMAGDHGTLLTAPRFAGKIFAKGIFVTRQPGLTYGYDLARAAVDRDRKMVDYLDLQGCTRDVLAEAVARRPDLLDPFFKLLEKFSDDVRGISSWSGTSVPKAAREKVAAKFRERYGDEAFPVADLAESREVEHLGKRGVVCSDAMRGVLAAGI